MSQTQDVQKFVILSSARSGSNMLVTMLDEHPQVRCFGEAFNPDYSRGYARWVQRSRWRRVLDRYARDRSVETYLDALLAPVSHEGNRAVGFKVIYPGQFDRAAVLRYYWRTEDFRAIWLIRHNLLRRYVSLKVASQENVWSAKEQRQKAISIRIDLDDLKRTLARMECINGVIEAVTHEFKGTTVSYEELVSNPVEAMANLFEFLGVSGHESERVKPRTAKQNPAPLRDVIENYEEVHALLRGTEHQSFLEEYSQVG